MIIERKSAVPLSPVMLFLVYPWTAVAAASTASSISRFFPSESSAEAASWHKSAWALGHQYRECFQLLDSGLQPLRRVGNHLLRLRENFPLNDVSILWNGRAFRTCFPTSHWSLPSAMNLSSRFFSVSTSTLLVANSFVKRFTAPSRISTGLTVVMSEGNFPWWGHVWN